ncbi:MAG: hypothetical protein OXN89_24845 [Bryobacterales bacterium]|nr:hypothetical protein [Bryobacterales bacterium]
MGARAAVTVRRIASEGKDLAVRFRKPGSTWRLEAEAVFGHNNPLGSATRPSPAASANLPANAGWIGPGLPSATAWPSRWRTILSGCSSNAVGQRLRSEIGEGQEPGRPRPRESAATIVSHIRTATAPTGLTVRAEFLPDGCATGIRIDGDTLAALSVTRHEPSPGPAARFPPTRPRTNQAMLGRSPTRPAHRRCG